MSKKYQVPKEVEYEKKLRLGNTCHLKNECKIRPNLTLEKYRYLNKQTLKLLVLLKLSKIGELHKIKRILNYMILIKLQKLQEINLGNVTLNTMITLEPISIKLKKR